ncbi:MAG: flagellar basal body P-ring formation chaperone FlgA [Desulfovibrionaceae bacterium]
MRNKLYYLIMFSLHILFTQELFAADPTWRIHIKENVILSSSKVYLKDIAFIVGNKESEEWKALSQTLLWEESSAFGIMYSMSKMRIQKLLREKLREKERFCIYPPTLRYQRGGYILTEEEIRKKVKEHLSSQVKKKYGGDVEITEYILPEAIFVSNASETMRIDSKSVRSGRMPFMLEIISSTQKPIKRFQASAFVNVYVDAFCVTEDIRKGELIQREDIILPCKKNSSLMPDIIVQEKDIQNTQARVGILRGSALTYADVEKIPAVKKGNIILLEYRNASISLVIEVEALKDGRIGEYIPVRNIQSKKSVTALVDDINKVLIAR